MESKNELKETDIQNIAYNYFNPIQDGGRGKRPLPTSFSPVKSTNVGINPQTSLTLRFNPFATLP